MVFLPFVNVFLLFALLGRVSKVTFAITMLESHANWFMKMLAFTLNQPDEWSADDVNLKNCAGTVFAINGFRKYFCIYHPKIRSAMELREDKGAKDFIYCYCCFPLNSVQCAKLGRMIWGCTLDISLEKLKGFAFLLKYLW